MLFRSSNSSENVIFFQLGLLFTLDGKSEAAKEVRVLYWSSWFFCDAGVFVEYLKLQDSPGQGHAVTCDDDDFLTSMLTAGGS